MSLPLLLYGPCQYPPIITSIFTSIFAVDGAISCTKSRYDYDDYRWIYRLYCPSNQYVGGKEKGWQVGALTDISNMTVCQSIYEDLSPLTVARAIVKDTTYTILNKSPCSKGDSSNPADDVECASFQKQREDTSYLSRAAWA